MSGVEPSASDIAATLRECIGYVPGVKVEGCCILFIPAAARSAIINSSAGDLQKLFTFLVWAGSNGFASNEKIKYSVVASLRDGDRGQMRPYLLKLEGVLPPGLQTLYLVTPHQRVSLSRLSMKTTTFSEYSMHVVATGLKTLHTHIDSGLLTEEFGGTLVYDNGDWVDMFLRFESSCLSCRDHLAALKSLQKRALELVVANMGILEIESIRETLGQEMRIIQTTSKQCHASISVLLNDLHQNPCRYQLSRMTPHFSAVTGHLQKLRSQLEQEMHNLDSQWQEKLNEFNQAHGSMQYIKMLDKCMDSLRDHLGLLHKACDDVGDRYHVACKLLESHGNFIESAQVDLLVMKGLFDQYFSFKGQKYIFRQDVIDVKRAELEGLGDMLARDLARRNLQLEKAKNLHELLEEATDLCETAFRELARHNLALCLTEEGSVNTLNTLESLQSQVLSIPTSKMASIANEMPVKSPLALSIDKMTSRRDDLLELLQTRQDGVAFVHQRHNLLKEKIKELSKPDPEDAVSLASPGALDHSMRSEPSMTIPLISTEGLSGSESIDSHAWDTDPGANTPDSMGEKRVPKRSSSMTHVLPGAPGYQRYPRAKSTGLIFGDNPSGILESPADEGDNRNYSIGAELEDEEDDLKVLENRRHIAQELVDTEKVYIDDIRATLDTYWAAMDITQNPNVPSFIAGKQTVAFCNLPVILDFHDKCFLLELENCQDDPLLLGKCFVRNCDQFQLYIPYCKNKHRSDSFFDDYEGSFFEELRIKRGFRLSVRDYLIKPVQRITKYQLLLKDMIKNCAKAPQAKTILQSGLSHMVEILQHANDIMHSGGIVGFPGSLLEQGHVLMQDTFQMLPNSTVQKVFHRASADKERQVFFYEQVIILTKKHPPRLGQRRTSYHYKEHIKLSEVALTENVAGDQCRFQVSQHRGSASFTLQAKNFDVKRAWVTRIRKCLEMQLRNLQDVHHREETGLQAYMPSEHGRHSVVSNISNVSADYNMWKASTLPASTAPQEVHLAPRKTISLDKRCIDARSRSCSPRDRAMIRSSSADLAENLLNTKGRTSPRSSPRSSPLPWLHDTNLLLNPDARNKGLSEGNLSASVGRSRSFGGVQDIKKRRKFTHSMHLTRSRDSSGSQASRSPSPSNSLPQLTKSQQETNTGDGHPKTATDEVDGDEAENKVTVKRQLTGKRRAMDHEEFRRNRKTSKNTKLSLKNSKNHQPDMLVPQICVVPSSATYLKKTVENPFMTPALVRDSDNETDTESVLSIVLQSDMSDSGASNENGNLKMQFVEVPNWTDRKSKTSVVQENYTECDL